MSRAAKVADYERTATMLDLLHRRYSDAGGMSLSHIVIEECAPGTGWRHANRYADALVLSVWPSNGLTLDGYEIKASRADLKKELSDLSKHEAIARYCDTWTLVAWDEKVLVEGIPEDWGILLTKDDGEHGREFVTHRKPTKRTPLEWPRTFICSMVRNASQQSPGAAYTARACIEAANKVRVERERYEKQRLRDAVEPIARALYGSNRWKWPAEAQLPETLIKIAAERLTQEVLTLEMPA